MKAFAYAEQEAPFGTFKLHIAPLHYSSICFARLRDHSAISDSFGESDQLI